MAAAPKIHVTVTLKFRTDPWWRRFTPRGRRAIATAGTAVEAVPKAPPGYRYTELDDGGDA
jgi:hypothetical protein